MRILVWLLRAFLFFTLFAFALNNSQEGVVRWFFGHEWRAPLVIIVLLAFGLGCAVGVLAMVPAWWKHRRVAKRIAPTADGNPAPGTAPNDPLNGPALHDGI
ncbi:lipopolysaccharide assembly LapA domain-containing protein [Paucibacter sp. DJ2R-2]|jgi:putative membrane protein|uniref:LapA family protein n=1 Tax=unclassified Roseateles TaxID=2626991 RepID=UPI0021E41A13|nr:LapA family protein [Paucibacter sp. DJ2R-2]MCV2420677.1 LapA family protein [Paucibacter sp. DJ4R-1]MCV2439876.1 LapA family protein [Paucibacter sp. DJ2R-2]